MNAERLLEVYEQISDAPDAIARLRRFVLDLAVRGKLVEQNVGDEPASELLTRIAVEKARLVKAGKIRKRKPFAAVDQHPFQIPQNWQWVRLGELGTTQTGSTPPKSRQDYYGSDVPFIRPGDLYPNHVDYSEQGLSRAGAEASGRLVREDSLLMVCIGTVGKCQIVDRLVSFNQQINTLSAFSDIAPRYILSAFQSDYFQQAAWAASARTTIAILNKGNWEKLPVPLPPLAEQHRIVAKVDELMALCDRLEEARKTREEVRDKLTAASLARLIAPDTTPEDFPTHANFAVEALPALTARPDQIKTLRQTILNLAVRGKLVEQDPADEPASELLEQIALDKASRVEAGTMRSQKALEPLAPSEREFEVPISWEWARLGEVVKLWNGMAFKSADFGKNGVPVVRIGDLQDGVVSLANAVRIHSNVASNVSEEVWIPDGALLLAMSGATTGKIAFNRTGQRLLLNQRVGRIEPFRVNIQFIRLFFETIVARNLSISAGSAIPNLSTKQINETAIPLPPLAEQHRIVAKVNALMALCDRLEAALTTTDTTRTRLLEALLHEALEPSNPKDEIAA
ncbi:restriction endonuclease subunit S [Sediminimonas qiaohouensis]|uniref:restriction endonuclease subunit S n=1 Tax=Sediminimonas qiaohouensis TaxID=552061 RepID=UPI0003F722A9|nr:restriction endonuclease subunit S [Sediminimonas qiaohouensis]